MFDWQSTSSVSPGLAITFSIEPYLPEELVHLPFRKGSVYLVIFLHLHALRSVLRMAPHATQPSASSSIPHLGYSLLYVHTLLPDKSALTSSLW